MVQRLIVAPLQFLVRLPWVLLITLICAPPLLVQSWLSPSTGPRVLRWYFEKCGGAYVKLGQVLASRYDLLESRYCDELAKLFDALNPVDTSRITAIIGRELGASMTTLFRDFEHVPIATASLAQVHGATLHSGDRVVVKVLKPNIERELGVDLWCFRVCGRLIDASPFARGMQVRAVVNELSRAVMEEVDFVREAQNTSYIRRRMVADSVFHYAPLVYPSLSSRRVLTLEYIEGITVRELIAAVSRDDQSALRRWEELGITPQRTAIIIFRSVLEQAVRFRSFNADPHPSNLIVRPGGEVAWVDFGLVGWLDEQQWELQLQLREAMANGRVHDAYQAMRQALGPLPPDRDLRAFEREMKQNLRDYLLTSDDPDAVLAERSLGLFLLRTVRAMARSRLPIAVDTVSLYRTILIADMVVLRLYPTIDWLGHMRSFLADLVPDVVAEALQVPLNSPYLAYQVAKTPATLATIAEQVRAGRPLTQTQSVTRRSVGDQALLTGIEVLRMLTWAVVVITLAGLVWRSALAGLVGPLGLGTLVQQPWPTLLVCGILLMAAGRLLRRAA